MVFNIKAYNELRKKHPNVYTIEINSEKDRKIYLSDDKNEYWETIETYNCYYSQSRVYFKPSGQLKQDAREFYFIPVGTIKHYNESGELTRSIYYTPDDWVDRLVALMKKDYGLDLSTKYAFKLIKIKNIDQKDGLIIQHLNGQPLSLDTYDPVRKYILLDFETLKVVAKGEVHAVLPDKRTEFERQIDAFPKAIETYYIDGKPFNFKWL